MKRYLIQNKETKEYVKKVSKRWPRLVKSTAEATLFTNPVAITYAIRNLENSQRYTAHGGKTQPGLFKYECIEVGVLIYRIEEQPFIDGVLK
jgi:hypothetical protein